ncbi:MAG: hypothetical protein V1729_05755, partial [Candidatus Woesearchaeota archaeon]
NPFFINGLETPRPEYSIRFFYLNWPIYFQITPNEGEIIKPSETIEIPRGPAHFRIPFIFAPTYYYEYYYDVSVPVIAEIKSYDEFFNETYTLFIAIEANVRDNRNLKEWLEGRGTYGPWDYSLFGVQPSREVFESIELEQGVNQDEFQSAYSSARNTNKSLFCNTRQRISGTVDVKVSNKVNGSAIDGAEVHYACGYYDSCRLGITELKQISNDTNETEAHFASKFPVCSGGGILRVEKPGFMTERLVELSTLPDNNQTIHVELEPIRTKNISFKKFVIDRIVFNDSLAEEVKLFRWNSQLKNLSEYDMILLTFNKINDSPAEEAFAKFVMFYGNDTLNEDMFRTVDLIPGRYTVDMQYFYTNKTIIPKLCKHVCASCLTDWCERECRLFPGDGNYTSLCEPDLTAAQWATTTAGGMFFGPIGGIVAGVGGAIGSALGVTCVKCGTCDADVLQPEDDISLENQILGGFKMNDTEPWVVTADDLDAPGNMVEVRVVHAPLPRCIDDLSEIANATNFYAPNVNFLQPRFVNSAQN